MSNFCPECFKEKDPYNPCQHDSDRDSSFIFSNTSDPFNVSERRVMGLTSESVLIVSPILGLALDFVIPNWSNPLIALLFAVLAGSLLIFVWRQRSSGFKFNPLNYLKNLPTYLIPPIGFSGGSSKAKLFGLWSAGLVISMLLQTSIFTPGNSALLENNIREYINRNSPVGLEVSCPALVFLPVGGQVTCEVATGVFGITVPARIQISPFTNAVDVKVSLN